MLYDYFRAPDAQTVIELMERTKGASPIAWEGEALADGVDAKGIEYAVTLGHLIALILDREWAVDLVTDEAVWPENLDSDEPDEEVASFVVEIGEPAVRVLAGADPGTLREIALRWAQIGELSSFHDIDTYATEVAADLCALARRTVAAGDQLYCWVCF